MKTARFILALILAATTVLGQKNDGQKSAGPKSDAKLAPYFPTPEAIVEKMLQLGGLKQGERMFDLGSGDGRIVIMAARKFKAEAVGVELDASLVKLSTDQIRTLGLSATARVI